MTAPTPQLCKRGFKLSRWQFEAAIWSVLQSMRYETSQKFAQDCRQQDLHGILYASAQHPHHSCLCLFLAGIERTKKLNAFALVEPGSGNLLRSVANAARGSQVPIVRE
nr:RES family NAD+ phosphorylase [uncultured Rhodoferax sp.]